MFTGRPQKNREAATTYFDEHLTQNDYYSQDATIGQQAGQWIGLGIERLGLRQGEAVNRDAFLRLCDNRHPSTDEQLTIGSVKGRRIFFDFQCAPPKSVSILAVTLEDRRIVQAHREASEVALRELESFASARVRRGGVDNQDRLTGNLVGASFLHTASRALDPQLHTHFVLFNASFDPTEAKWKALQTSAMFEAIHYATAVYRNELAKGLRHLGYGLRRTNTGFEIEGVSTDLIERFSKRSKQRDEAVRHAEKRLGRRLTRNEIAHVVHQSRPKKLKDLSERELQRRQLHEIGFFEKRALRKLVAGANGIPTPPLETVGHTQALEYGLAHVFERQSVAPQHRIMEAALVRGCGQLELDRLKEELGADSKLVRVGQEFSTREILKKELFLIDTVNAGINATCPIADRYEAPAHLGPDQRRALTHLITTPDHFTGFRGLAGTGKSTALMELARVLLAEGWEPVFCAPTAAAVDVLRKDLKSMRREPVTIAKLLTDGTVHNRISSRSVLVVDEAGAVGLDDMTGLFELATSRQARVILSGDTGQHAAVARGDALRIIEEYSNYRFAELTTIRRQKQAEFREVVKLAARKQTAQAFQMLERLGAVTEDSTDGTLYDQAAATYLNAHRQGRSALLVSPTWIEIEAVTRKVREALKAEGTLAGDDRSVTAFDSLSWTLAQKKNADLYNVGHQIRFVRSTGTFIKGEMVEVVATDGDGIQLRRTDGSEATVRPVLLATSVDVGQKRELKIAVGERLLLQANAAAGGRRFINGERVQVKRFIGGGALELTDGRMLPADYQTFTHGYAVTSHSSQGRTDDEVLVVASSKSFAAVSQEQFYVSISRARERIQVFTDDVETLRRRVTDSHERKAALELAGLRKQLASIGLRHIEASPPEGSVLATDSRFRAIRDLRPMRITRLAPVQRIIRAAGEFVRRVAQQVRRVQRPAETMTPTIDSKVTNGMTPAKRNQVYRPALNRFSPRQSQSRGVSI